MIKWQDIPTAVQALVAMGALTAMTAGMLTYHDQFVTDVEAAEAEVKSQTQLILLRVDNKKAEIRTLTRDKAKAKESGNVAEEDRLSEDLKTLREEVKSLCAGIKDC